MKKYLASILSICVLVSYANARLINTQPTSTPISSPDIVCFGGRVAGNLVKNATEVCIDSNGNLIPTDNTANVVNGIVDSQSLGSVTNPWGTVYFGTQVFISYNSANVAFGTSPFVSGGLGLTGPAGSCGSAVTNITGTDFAGVLTLGTGSSSACTIGFQPTFVNTPICSITFVSGNISLNGNGPGVLGVTNPIILPTSIQFNTSLQAPERIDFSCIGNQQ